MKIINLLKRENNNFDLIRIMLAILVILSHAPTLNGTSKYWFDPVVQVFGYSSGAIAVQLFFFISGLFVTTSLLRKNDALEFILARLFRVMPALIFVVITSTVFLGLFVSDLPLRDYFTHKLTYSHVIDNIMFKTHYALPDTFTSNYYPIAVNGSLWSLRYEIGAYMFLISIYIFLRDKPKYLLNILSMAIIVEPLLPFGLFFRWISDSQGVNVLPAVFALGALLAINAEQISIRWIHFISLLILYHVFSNSPFKSLLIILIFVCATVLLAQNKWVKQLHVKHDISYGIYLWGFVVQQTLYHFSGHLIVHIHFGIALIISIGLAYLTHFTVERPGIAMGKYLINKLSKPKVTDQGNVVAV